MANKNKRKEVVGVLAGVLFTACLLVGIVILSCHVRIRNYAKELVYDDTEQIPENKVGLLLGTTPMLKNGRSNLYFDYRIEAAAELYKSEKIKYILISGDNRRRNYNEPEEMKKALLMYHIPDSVIVLDYAGLRTLDSVVRAREISGKIVSPLFLNDSIMNGLCSWLVSMGFRLSVSMHAMWIPMPDSRHVSASCWRG